jgi:predicted nucleotidyltransferase
MNPEAQVPIEQMRPNLADLCRRFGVRKLWVFGSALSARWQPETSDFDFLVEYGPPPPGIDLFAQQFVMQVELERLLGRSVDLVERVAIRKTTFRETVDRDAQEVYAA